MQRNFAQKSLSQFLCRLTGTLMAENIRPGTAMLANIIAHIFHNAQNRHINFFEHINAFYRINQRNILRGRNNNRTGKIQFLRQRNLNISGSRRHIDNQHIRSAPVNLGQKLLNGPAGFGPAPNQRNILINQRTDGHRLNAQILKRFKSFAVIRHRCHPLISQHRRNRRPVNIGIKQSRFKSGLG